MEKLALNPLWKVFGTRSRRQIAVTVEGSVGLDASTTVMLVLGVSLTALMISYGRW